MLREPDASEDFPESAYDQLFPVEEKHFWFRARNRVILAALRAVLGDIRGLCALEVGCGTGQVLACLDRAGIVVCGLDMYLKGLTFARRRTDAPLVCADARDMPFRDEFDLTLLCDVLEHASDELTVLRNCLTATRPGGLLLVTVPAGTLLWSCADEHAGHKRRYNRKALDELLVRAGAEVELLRYFNSLITLPMFLRRRIRKGRRVRTAREMKEFMVRKLRVPPWPLNGILHALISLEAALLPHISAPWGASLIAVARRPV